MDRHHETPQPQPWRREPNPWEPEPSAAGRAIIRQWIDYQLALVAERRRRHWPHHGETPPPVTAGPEPEPEPAQGQAPPAPVGDGPQPPGPA